MNETLHIPVIGGPSKIVRFCDAVIRWTILGLMALVPLFFLPWTIEVIELNKQLLVISGAVIAGMAWLGKMLAERRFEYRRSIVNVFVVLYVIAYGLSAWNSQSRYLSMMGDFGQELAGFVTVLAFATIYFVISNNFRDSKALRTLLMATVLGGFLSGLFALVQGLGLFILPFSFAKTASFNSVGTVASLGVYMAFIVTLCGGMLLADRGDSMPSGPKWLVTLDSVILVATAVIGIALISVVDYWPVTVSLLVSSAIMITFAFVHAKNVRGIGGVLLPIAALVVSGLLLLFRFPVTLGYPAEVMPSFKASMDITVKTLRDHPLLGSGPGTFIYDYAKYRVADVNASQFWNVRFDRGSARILTSLATTGFVGALSWLLVALLLLWSAGRTLLKTDEESWHLLIGVFAAWVALLVARFTYSESMTLEFAFWATMAALVVSHRKDFFSVRFENSPRAAMGVSFIFILGLVFALSGLFIEGTRYSAEIAYAKAIRTDNAGGSADDVVKNLLTAVQLNGQNEVYQRNLALGYLSLANRTLNTTSKIDKKKDEKQEDYDKRVKQARADQLQLVTSYTANAVNVAKNVTDMSGNNVANWSVLGSIYEGLMGVTDEADTWAVKSYQKAIELEPANPENFVELGKVYMWQSDQHRTKTDTQDAKVKADEQKKTDELLGKAVEQFTKSVTLKADYAPGHYNLSLAYDRQGKLKDAISKMESVIRYNPQDIGVPFQLALLYYRDGRKDDAIAVLEAVVSRQPSFANARWYLASMYEEKSQFDKALDQVTEVAKLNPDNDAVKQKVTDLTAKKAAGPGLPAPVETPTTNQNQPGVKH
ncbi:MAG: hypothetical protein RLZZ324_593 [Candidatus Parcubacteria bacterium]|jgi:tetratricopeptide (TPR) repeat protein